MESFSPRRSEAARASCTPVVDEATPPAPASATAEVLVRAERLVLDRAAAGTRACVVRLSGLYGPGRVGVVERVRSGALALGPGDGAWMNFCHLDDAIAFVVAALDRASGGGTFHGSDARPARRREVVEWIARRIGIAPPTNERGGAGPDRRISSVRTRRTLGIELRWPSFADGLAPLVPGSRGR
jgi:nucleoside-diphosphate-sugar epimerase